MARKRRRCKVTLSGLHVYESRSWSCRCGKRAPLRDRERLEAEMRALAVEQEVARVRLGLAQ